MTNKTVIAAFMAVCVAAPAVAQEFTGGEIGLEYNLDIEDTNNDGASYNAGVEFAFGREYAIAVTAQNLDVTDSSSSTNLTLHGVYHLNPSATVGVFYSRDDDDVAGYGVEAGTVIGLGEIGGYFGQRSLGSEDVTIAGFESRTKVAEQITFFTDFDIVSDSNVGSSKGELGVSYTFDQGPEAFVQVGRTSQFGDGVLDDDQTYIGVGARITFGAARGTTFEGR